MLISIIFRIKKLGDYLLEQNIYQPCWIYLLLLKNMLDLFRIICWYRASKNYEHRRWSTLWAASYIWDLTNFLWEMKRDCKIWSSFCTALACVDHSCPISSAFPALFIFLTSELINVSKTYRSICLIILSLRHRPYAWSFADLRVVKVVMSYKKKQETRIKIRWTLLNSKLIARQICNMK